MDYDNVNVEHYKEMQFYISDFLEWVRNYRDHEYEKKNGFFLIEGFEAVGDGGCCILDSDDEKELVKKYVEEIFLKEQF